MGAPPTLPFAPAHYAAEVGGVVSDENGQPFGSICIQASLATDPEANEFFGTSSDSTGRYRLPLARGTWLVEFYFQCQSAFSVAIGISTVVQIVDQNVQYNPVMVRGATLTVRAAFDAVYAGGMIRIEALVDGAVGGVGYVSPAVPDFQLIGLPEGSGSVRGWCPVACEVSAPDFVLRSGERTDIAITVR